MSEYLSSQPTNWEAIVTEIGSNQHEAVTRHYREVCVLLKQAEAEGNTVRIEELKQQKVGLKAMQPAFISSVTLQGGRAKYITASMIVARFGSGIRLSPVQVGRVLKELGFEQKRTPKTNFWSVVERTSEEIYHQLPETE